MQPSPDVHVSHVVTQFDTHEVSLVAHALVHAPPSHAAAQLCSISAHVPAQLVASIRQSAPHPEASVVGGGALSNGGLWASLASVVPSVASVPPSTGVLAPPPPSPEEAAGLNASKSWKHPTRTTAEAAAAAGVDHAARRADVPSTRIRTLL